MVTSESLEDLDAFGLYLKSVYPETRTTSGTLLDYVGMTFDFTTVGEVRITMDKCVDDILSECGVITIKVTSGAAVLFDVRDAQGRQSQKPSGFIRTSRRSCTWRKE